MSQKAADPKFDEMTFGQKIVFVGKFILFICSFGFAFPTLITDTEYAGGVNRTYRPGGEDKEKDEV